MRADLRWSLGAWWGLLVVCEHATCFESGAQTMVEAKGNAKIMKKGQQFSSSLNLSSNMILILFSLIVAFMVGFLASPISRSSVRCSTSPPSSPLPVSPSPVKEVTTTTTSTLGSRTTSGFVSHLQTLPDDLLRFHYSCPAATAASPAEARATVIDDVFDGRSPYTGFPPPHIARLVKQQKIKGWGSDNPVFERLIKEVRPRVVVELGTFLGASAIHMSRVIQKTLADEEEQDFAIFCLDDFRGWPGFRKTFTDIGQEHGNAMLFNQFLQNVAYSNASGNIVPVPFSTNTGLYKLCELGIKADLIEVDAGHDFHSAWTDINLAWSLMRPDGKSVMFGHDYFNGADYHGVQRAVDLFAKLKGLRVEPDGQHWIYRPLDDSVRSSSASKSRMTSKRLNEKGF